LLITCIEQHDAHLAAVVNNGTCFIQIKPQFTIPTLFYGVFL